MSNAWTIASILLKVLVTVFVVGNLVALIVQVWEGPMGVPEGLTSAAIILAIGISVWVLAVLFDRRGKASINSAPTGNRTSVT